MPWTCWSAQGEPTMDRETSVTGGYNVDFISAHLRAPRAAAIAGIIFSVLMIGSLWLLRLSVSADPLEAGEWLASDAERVVVAVNLVPFSGIAFIWFSGVLRDRLGKLEDQFFATVFLGSGLLFLGMMFVAAASVGGLIIAYSVQPKALFESGTFSFARASTCNIMQIYAVKMAAVFMVSSSTLALRTRCIARWLALLGYASAVFLLLGGDYFSSAVFVFPVWVLLVSGYILIDNLSEAPSGAERS
jgi:hypothetical protein